MAEVFIEPKPDSRGAKSPPPLDSGQPWHHNLRFSVLAALVLNAANKGVFHLFAANVTIGVLAFGAQLLVVKFLTPAELGYIKTLQSFMAIATLLAGFGFNTAVVKLCSEKNSPGARAYIFRKCFSYSLVPIAATMLFLIAAAQLKWFSPVEEVNAWMPVYMLMVPGFVLAGIAMLYLQATKQIKLMATTQTLTRLFGAGLVVLSTFMLQFPGYVYATVVVNTAALLPLLWMLRNEFRSQERVPNVLGLGMYYAKWGLVANVVQTIGANLDILLLNYLWSDRADIGLYGVATILLLGLNQITGTIQSIATPYFSEKSDNQQESWRVLKKYQWQLIGVAFLATAAAIIVVPPLVGYIYGAEYSAVGDYFCILSVRYFLWSCYALSAVAMLGAGRMKLYAGAVSISTVVTFVLTFIAIADYGPIGAAFAQVIGGLVALVMVTLMARNLYAKPWH